MAQASTQLTTSEVRLSFVHVFEPYARQDSTDTPAYSTVIMVPKDDEKTIGKIRAAQKAALEKGKDSKFNGRIPKSWTDTFRDGDDSDRPEYEGHWYMTVKSQQSRPPLVVDRNKEEILDQRELYSGVYAQVAIDAFPFNSNGNKGVSFQLLAVRKLRDGEPLGGGAPVKVDDVFDDLDEDEALI